MSGKRGGLGRNLSALLGTSYSMNQVSTPATELLQLSLDALQPGKYQPRTAIEEASIQELSDSIKQQGLLQPILVRKLSSEQYEIIAGERRWRACQLAGLTEVPVILHQVDDETAMAVALVENLQREDLNPMDQARAMDRLSREFSLTHQEIAELLSKSRAAVSNFLRLLSLTPEVRRLLEHGDLDMGHARALLALEESQQIQVANVVVAKNLSVRDTERLVTRVKENKLPNTAVVEPPYPPAMHAQVQELAQCLNAKVKLKPGKAGKGALVIHYESMQSLQEVILQIIR